MTSRELASRKGVLVIPNGTLQEPNEDTLRRLFTEFFPLSMVPDVSADGLQLNNTLYLGMSPQFDVVKTGVTAPTYTITMKDDRAVFTKIFPKPIVKDVVKGEVEYIRAQLKNNPTPELKLEYQQRLGELFESGYIELK